MSRCWLAVRASEESRAIGFTRRRRLRAANFAHPTVIENVLDDSIPGRKIIEPGVNAFMIMRRLGMGRDVLQRRQRGDIHPISNGVM